MSYQLSRRQFVQYSLAATALSPIAATAQNYSQNEEFQRWKQQQLEDFSAFNGFYKQAFNDYKANVAVNWGAQPQMRDRKIWVDYTNDVKRAINFEEGYAEVAVIQKEGMSFEESVAQARERMQALFNESKQRLIEKDPVEKSIQQRVQQAGMSMRRDTKPTKEPVFKVVTPSVNQIQQAEPKVKQLNNGKKVATIRVPLNGSNKSKRKPLLPQISSHSQEYGLSPALISAIIQAESAFNPMATSHIPAYGLMQIVPSSAGIDVSNYLYQKKQLFSPDWLYNPENNILAGSTYLHILNSRYLKSISNPQSREYCVIAAYNTGAGNMAKAFSRNGLKSAVAKINSKQPSDVYRQLERKLPYEETQRYLGKVSKYKSAWEQA